MKQESLRHSRKSFETALDDVDASLTPPATLPTRRNYTTIQENLHTQGHKNGRFFLFHVKSFKTKIV